MIEPGEGFAAGVPRLHYLEWNRGGAPTIVLLHGNTANAWWWEPLAREFGSDGPRLLALDLRGHGDSDAVRPAAYSPHDHVRDVARFIGDMKLERPLVAGHSMGGIVTVALAAQHPELLHAAIAIDLAITSSPRRNRYLRHLRMLPLVAYPTLEMARARFRLMPNEGTIPAATLAAIADRSLRRAATGGYTLKFDRESFFGGDGLDVGAAIARVAMPLLLVRAGRSRIMTAEAAAGACASNPRAELIEIPDAHHHVPLECPERLAAIMRDFVARRNGAES